MGTLFYVVGASGAGKDSLMTYARARLAGCASTSWSCASVGAAPPPARRSTNAARAPHPQEAEPTPGVATVCAVGAAPPPARRSAERGERVASPLKRSDRMSAPVFFAHRYITRPAEAGGESHVAVTHFEFAQMKSLGLFVLDWESHGHCYGLGIEVQAWLERGANVVMNGSRGFLSEASRRFPDLCVVLVEVSLAALRARLEARGREPTDEIEKRIARASQFFVSHPNLVTIRNDGALAEAGERFVALLRETVAEAAVGAK